MRTAILVLSAALFSSACATAVAAPASGAAPTERSAVEVATAAEGELTLEIAELI